MSQANPILPPAKIAVVGLGKAGLPAARRLRDWGAEVICWDDRPEARAAAEAAGLTVADPAAAPLIDPNYWAEPEDLEMSLRGLQMAREILQ